MIPKYEKKDNLSLLLLVPNMFVTKMVEFIPEFNLKRLKKPFVFDWLVDSFSH
jgi:hypothetical protein